MRHAIVRRTQFHRRHIIVCQTLVSIKHGKRPFSRCADCRTCNAVCDVRRKCVAVYLFFSDISATNKFHQIRFDLFVFSVREYNGKLVWSGPLPTKDRYYDVVVLDFFDSSIWAAPSIETEKLFITHKRLQMKNDPIVAAINHGRRSQRWWKGTHIFSTHLHINFHVRCLSMNLNSHQPLPPCHRCTNMIFKMEKFP